MTQSASKLALKALKKALPEFVLFFEKEERYRASMDNMRFSRMPAVVIRPDDEAQIEKLLKIANQHKIPITTRGAGSATTGATTPAIDGWVLDLSDWKNLHIDPDSMMAYVQPGVTVQQLDDAARECGLFYPPDPGSKKYATIGGTIACNAGGLRGAKYGVTRDYVYALEGFLPTGEFVRWGLDVKKFVSGYNIRDLWIGSEGTLGIITGTVLKLIPRPAHTLTFLASFDDEIAALNTAHAILKTRQIPAILEFLDQQTVDCFTRLKSNKPDPDHFARFEGKSLLLIEFDGSLQDVEAARLSVESLFQQSNISFEVTTQPEAAEQLWQVRRGCSKAMFQWGDRKLNEDIVVPLRAQHELIQFTRDLKDEIQLPTPTFGHAADGNFHVHIMYHSDQPNEVKRAQLGIRRIMEKVVALGGAITGEHGIGLAKSNYLPLQHEPVELKLMRGIKELFDPNHILNPDKWFEPFDPSEHPREDFQMPWDH